MAAQRREKRLKNARKLQARRWQEHALGSDVREWYSDAWILQLPDLRV